MSQYGEHPPVTVLGLGQRELGEQLQQLARVVDREVLAVGILGREVGPAEPDLPTRLQLSGDIELVALDN